MILGFGSSCACREAENVPLARENGDYDVTIRADRRGHLVGENTHTVRPAFDDPIWWLREVGELWATWSVNTLQGAGNSTECQGGTTYLSRRLICRPRHPLLHK